MSACAQMCAPDQVATGIARLTIRNTGAVISAVASDDLCGFESPDVLANPEVTGAVGSEGSITWTVTDCDFDFGGGLDLEPDCDGVVDTLSGGFTVSATKTIGGLLTGVEANPIIPGGPEAVTIELTKVSFDEFKVEVSDSEDSLTWVEGGLTATFEPLLAVDAALGACAIVTPNANFSDVRYSESTVHVTSPDLDEEIPVAASDLAATNGKVGSAENALSGEITVWDGVQKVPMEGDSDGLDPDYGASDFIQAFACGEGLTDPVSYECADMTPMFADGAARLSANLFAAVAGAVADDTSCGFGSAAVQGAATTSGTLGGDGSITFTVSGCAINFATPTVVSTDCAGVDTLLEGSVTVSGTQTITGLFNGGDNPVIPDMDDGAVLDLDLDLSGLTVSSSDGNNALTVSSGTLSGMLTPRLAVDNTTGACSVQSSIARFADLTYTGAELILASDSGTFDLSVSAAELDAVNGTWGSESNVLSGSVTIDGTAYTVPSDGLGLNPEFSQATHDAGWQCNPDLATPISHACGSYAFLADGAARASISLVANALGIIADDANCGFSAPATWGGAAYTAGVGDVGTATLTVTDCSITLPADTVISTDCGGNETTASGTITVSGTQVLNGWITGDQVTPIVPTTDTPGTVTGTVTFDNFVLTSGDTTFTAVSGAATGTTTPRYALGDQGVCSVSTGITRIADVSYTGLELFLQPPDGNFSATVSTADLDALVGTWDTESNTLAGDLTIEGETFTVPLDGLGLLDDFDQASFDASWQCTPGLVTPVAHTCAGTTPLAQGAGRALVNLAVMATNMLNDDTTCGFESMPVLGTPTVTGTPGGPGAMTWTTSATPCAIHIPVSTAVSTDCTGSTRHVMGTVTGNADKTIAGFLTGDMMNPIVPLSRDAATIALTSLVFEDFELFELPFGVTDPDTVLTFSGTMTGVGLPVLGESATATFPPPDGAPVYSYFAPVLEIVDLQLTSGTLTLFTEGKTFNLTLGAVDLDAFMGAYFDGTDTYSNSIAGTVTVEGDLVTLPDPRLDDMYDQAAFDLSYSCDPELLEPIPYE